MHQHAITRQQDARCLLIHSPMASPAHEPPAFVHQDCEACNAGRGSNLTMGGTVECDASVMDDAGAFGAVAAVPGITCPVVAAMGAFYCRATAMCTLQRGLAVVAAEDRAAALHLHSNAQVVAVVLATPADCGIDATLQGWPTPSGRRAASQPRAGSHCRWGGCAPCAPCSCPLQALPTKSRAPTRATTSR